MITAVLFTIAKAWKQSKYPLTEELGKEVVVHTYSGMLATKKWNNAICSNMNEPGDHHTKWSKSGRKRQVSCDIAAAAAAAKSLQSRLTLCDPTDGSPSGSAVPGILQARTVEWVAISFSNVWKWKVKVKSLSGVWLLVTPWTAAYQAPPSMGFSRQEYWSGVPLPHLIIWYYLYAKSKKEWYKWIYF